MGRWYKTMFDVVDVLEEKTLKDDQFDIDQWSSNDIERIQTVVIFMRRQLGQREKTRKDSES